MQIPVALCFFLISTTISCLQIVYTFLFSFCTWNYIVNVSTYRVRECNCHPLTTVILYFKGWHRDSYTPAPCQCRYMVYFFLRSQPNFNNPKVWFISYYIKFLASYFVSVGNEIFSKFTAIYEAKILMLFFFNLI